MAVIVAGFLKESPPFLRGVGANPAEESVTPAIFVLGGQGAAEAQRVLLDRGHSIEHGIARTFLHIDEAMHAATQSDKYVAKPSSHVLVRPRTTPPSKRRAENESQAPTSGAVGQEVQAMQQGRAG
jgi:hypothetical protein